MPDFRKLIHQKKLRESIGLEKAEGPVIPESGDDYRQHQVDRFFNEGVEITEPEKKKRGKHRKEK